MGGTSKKLRRMVVGLLPTFVASVMSGGAGAQALPEWQTLLERIVNINSGTRNIEGLDAVRQVLIPEFEKLGLAATTLELEDGHKLLSMMVPGGSPELLLMGHIDTVFGKEFEFQGYERRGDSIYGPGVIDMKGGIVLMLGLLQAYKGSDQLGKFMVLINDDEEIGSPYSNAQVKELVADVKAGLVFEPGLPGGAVVTSHSGVHWLTLTVEGRAAHAGLEPEKGINACVELADKVVRISKLSDPDSKLLVNVGVIKGGTKPNIVCETAEAGIDVRFVEKDDLQKVLAEIQTITDQMVVYNPLLEAAPTAGLKAVVTLPSMPPSSTERLYGLLQIAGKKTNQEVSGEHVGYGTDAGHLVETGMEVLVGLGPYGGGTHTEEERLVVSTYQERLDLTKALVDEILR